MALTDEEFQKLMVSVETLKEKPAAQPTTDAASEAPATEPVEQAIAQQDAESAAAGEEMAPAMPTPKGISDDKFQALMGEVESITTRPDGQKRPRFANGLSPETPILASPLSVGDRFKLKGLATEAKGQKMLEEMFPEGVMKTGPKDYRVKKDGLWYEVDPQGFGKSPWEATKELLSGKRAGMEMVIEEAAKDLADIAPELAFVGGSAAVAAATGGTSLLAQIPAQLGMGAGLEISRQYLGKLHDVYEAPVEEQISDIAMESALNLFGVAHAAGRGGISLIKQGAKSSKVIGAAKEMNQDTASNFMAKALDAGAERVSQMSEGVKETLAGVYGSLTGVGGENMLRYLERPKEVAGLMKSSLQGKTSEAAMETLKTRQIQAGERILNNFQPAMNKYYDDMAQQISREIGNAPVDITVPAKRAADTLKELGLFKDVDGAMLTLQELGLIDDVGVGMQVVSETELAQKAVAGEGNDVINALYTEGNYKKVKNALGVVKRALDIGSNKSTGSIKDLFAQEKQLSNSLKAAKDALEKSDAPKVVVDAVDRLQKGLVDSVDLALDKVAAGKNLPEGRVKSYKQLRQNYRQTADELRAVERLARDKNLTREEAAQQLVRKFLSPTKATRTTQAESVSRLSKTLGQYSPEFKQAEELLLDSHAAMSFMPVVAANNIKYGAQVAAAGTVGAAVGGQAARMEYGLGAAAGTAALTSPRGAMKMLNLMKGLRKGRDFVITRPYGALQELTKNEQAFGSFIRSITSVDALEQQAQQGLENAAGTGVMQKLQGQEGGQ